MTRTNSTAVATALVAFWILTASPAHAGPEDNLTAIELTVETSGNTVLSTFDYFVTDLPPFGNVEAYTIEVGLDKTGNGAIDVLVASLAGSQAGGLHSAVFDIRPSLDALSGPDRVEDGDTLVAVLDANNNINELFGFGEGDNEAVSIPLYVDIKPESLVLDAAHQAILTFLVDSPAKVRQFMVEFYLDDNPQNGSLDPTDTVIFSTYAGGRPGIRQLTADYSGNPPATGQLIFASVDVNSEVGEAREGNNTVWTPNVALTDLVAVALQYDPGSQDAALDYLVQGPTAVAPYNIEFIVDTDGNGTPSAGDTIVSTVAGATSPGVHTLTEPLAANPPASGQFLFAVIDRPTAANPVTGTVIESEETANNVAATVDSFATDLAALTLGYDANTQNATLSYLVDSPTALGPYAIQFILDRDGSGTPNAGDAPPVATVVGNGMPGAYVLVQSFAGDAPVSNQMVFAVLDRFNQVVEDDETNNVASAINTAPTDLVAVSLSYDANTQDATLSYTVVAPIPVTAYDIEFALDTDNSGTPSAGDTIIATVPGNATPGSYALTQSYAGDPAAAGQFVFAWIDRANSVTELIEVANNRVGTFNTAAIDLEAVALSYDSNTMDASLSYVVNSPIAVAPYLIDFILDADNSGTIGAGDPVVQVLSGATMPGAVVVIASFAGNPPSSGQAIFARVDRDDDVIEADENNNVATAINTAPTDLVANLLGSLTYDSNTQEATFTYEVVAPGPVPAYDIAFVLDADNNFALSFGDVIVGVQPGNAAPGLSSTTQSFAALPPASGQALFAVLDFAPPPFGNVVESDESNNVAATINTAVTDLAVVDLTYDANTRSATLSYVVNSPIGVAGNFIFYYLETNGVPGLQDPSDTLVSIVTGVTAPGAHTAILDYSANPPASSQIIYATIDSTDQVVETDENNNLGIAMNTMPTDLVAVSLAYDSNTEEATLSYTVNSPVNVAPFIIRFFLDRDHSGTLSAGDGPPVGDVAGQIAPGSYTATLNYAGNVPASGQFLFAALDWPLMTGGQVAESDEFGNNLATTANSAGTDLVANAINVLSDNVNNETTAVVVYTVVSPIPVNPFSLKVGMDRDANGRIDGGPGDVLADILIISPADLSPGAHAIVVPNFRAALNTLPPTAKINFGNQILATLDLNPDGSPAGAVTEVEEELNNVVGQLPTVDLVANAVTVLTDPSAATTRARVSYTVESPGGVDAFNVRVGVDRNNDRVIDDPADVLDVIAVTGADLRPGPRRVTTSDFRAALNGVLPALSQGDRIIAIIDLLQNNTPENAVVELEENANNVVSERQKVDLVANSLTVTTDVLGGTTEADVSYTVDSPGSVAEFSLKVGVDRDLDGNIDDPDGILADVLITGADRGPGPHTVNIPGLRAALNGLVTPIKNGDAIVATLDLTLAGANEGSVGEDVETANNATSQLQTVDLVANSISITSDDVAGITTADVFYTVNGPADVAAFDLRIGVDRDGDNVIDPDPSDLLATIPAPTVLPGSHTATTPDLRPALEALTARLQDGDHIIATLDVLAGGAPANNVVEAEETANNVTGESQTVDLVAIAVEVGHDPVTGETLARVNYTINSPGAVEPFNVRVGIDADNDRIIDAGTLLTTIGLATQPADRVRPGNRQVLTAGLAAALNALPNPLHNGDRVIATLDILDDGLGSPENAVVELDETDNNITRQPQVVDLVAISLAYDSNLDIATLSYDVNSIGVVAAYDIEFWLDSDNNGLFDPGFDTLVDTEAGDVLPGTYTATGDFSGNIPQTAQFIFAVIDPADAMFESDENNNLAATDNSEITDLVANAISINSDNVTDTTTATVAYTVNAPDDVPAFDIRIGVDRDGDNVIDPDPTDVLAVIAAPGLSPGAHTANVPDLRPALEALATRLNDADRLIASLDLMPDGTPVNSVVETGGDETGNNVTAHSVQVDLVATSVDVSVDSGTGETIACVKYTIVGPGAVTAFNIRIGVDADDDMIVDPGSLLATIDVATRPASMLRPGDHTMLSADLATALGALAPPLHNGDRVIATLDILDDGAGTPENAVVEHDDSGNNLSRKAQTVDLVAQSVFLTTNVAAGTTSATVAYVVNSIGPVAPFTLRIGVDRDGDDIIDPDPTDLLLAQALAGPDLTPGEHVFNVADIRPALNGLAAPLAFGDRVIATLDLTPAGTDEAAVVELIEVGNNVTTTAGTQEQIIDLVADSLDLNVGSFVATVSYDVIAPANVAPFVIRIGRDTDGDNVMDDAIIDLAGQVTPGAHQVQTDIAGALRALGVLAGETVTIVADVDSHNGVTESHETNNKLAASADYLVDLQAVRLNHPCAVLDTTFDAAVVYRVEFNQPGEDFTIGIYASPDGTVAIGASDVLLGAVTITDPAMKTVGEHTVVVTNLLVSAGSFPTAHFHVKARIDDVAALNELDETNNIAARPNAANDPSEDADGDGVPNCIDGCPNDPAKIAPGACGCGTADTDSDGDGVPDCLDGCPMDPDKIAPGICGCGVVDDLTDNDGDGVIGCLDPDDTDPNTPTPQPAPQPVPPAGPTFQPSLGIFLPLIPPLPVPVPFCGIGLCGPASIVPIAVTLAGMAGMKRRSRRRTRGIREPR